ncbi:MAG TPA: hypothetical protein VL899_07415 [Alphaproteobacteria bacterium]|jgi:hypothetical protein|nr:hypothetical protein [Alphaproteobacteria bacterium]
MDDKDIAKKPAGKPPASHETDAELNEKVLQQISGGAVMAPPAAPHRQTPFDYY